ncbi:MAG: bacterial Ig-like domain-containing protein [Clostridia bacterium]|nr:bacterial Ig-like domain-containing protein [Clostridia bacterium]
MTNKKKMYKYTSMISMAIVLMLIANLVLPMLSMADGEEIQTMSSFSYTGEWSDEEQNVTNFKLESVLERTKGENDSYSNELVLNVNTSCTGKDKDNIKYELYWATVTYAQADSTTFYSKDDIETLKETLKNNDTFDETIGKLEEFVTDHAEIAILDTDANAIKLSEEGTASREFKRDFGTEEEDKGYYYAIILAYRSITNDAGEVEMEEAVGANICMIEVNVINSNPIETTDQLESITIKTPPTKNEYVQGEEIVLDGGEITATYSDGSTKDIAMTDAGVSIKSGSPANVNEEEITISYTEKGVAKTATFNVTVTAPVVEKTIESIAVKQNPKKMEYNQGDAIDLADGVITITYNDGSTDELSMTDPSVAIKSGSPADSANPTVTIVYSEKEASFGITVNTPVNDKAVDFIAVKTNPTKTTYTQGDEVDLTGGVITVTYDDGSTDEVSMTNTNVRIKSGSPADEANKTVVIVYAEKEATFNITVNAKQEEENPKTDDNNANKEDNNKEDNKKEENNGSGTGTNNSNSANNSGNKNTSTASNSSKTTTNVNPNKATGSMPQTGSNNTGVIAGIVVFSLLGIVNFVKYKNMK